LVPITNKDIPIYSVHLLNPTDYPRDIRISERMFLDNSFAIKNIKKI
jgi:hypothetical protein